MASDTCKNYKTEVIFFLTAFINGLQCCNTAMNTNICCDHSIKLLLFYLLRLRTFNHLQNTKMQNLSFFMCLLAIW